MIATETTKVVKVSLDEQTARIMPFKKVRWFLGKLCIQKEGDVANNNIPWAPSTEWKDAVQILETFSLGLKFVGDRWVCYSEFEQAYDTDPLVAICKSLIVHYKRG